MQPNQDDFSVSLWRVLKLFLPFQKHEKPKYVLCVAFAENGDTITGDSSGNIYIWAKGTTEISHSDPNSLFFTEREPATHL